MNNYLDVNSIDPKHWGKCGWIFLNSIALTYNVDYKEQYKTFFINLQYVLPCKTCGENLKKNLDNIDEALLSKQNLFLWLLNIRNEIAKSKNRPDKTISDSMLEIYPKTDNRYLYIYLLLVILALLISLFIFIQQKYL